MQTYWQARMLLLIIALVAGGGVAVWFGTGDYLAAQAEAAPTALAIAAFNQYGGQRWLKVERGVFLTDRAVVRNVPRGPEDTEDQAVLYVPLVPRDWRPDEPVHVICKLGPGPRAGPRGGCRKTAAGRSAPSLVSSSMNPPRRSSRG